MYLLGLDIGSSSIKAALVDADSAQPLAVVQQPKREMGMIAHQPGWAEQEPETWWQHVCAAIQELLSNAAIDPAQIKGIGIAYQMHGLVLVDKDQNVLRPSIIWCDSRAVEIGNESFDRIGQKTCLAHLLNSPGNFTASKLAWVKQYEPELFAKIDKLLLPGDYIAMRLTGEAVSTITGLSEGILWDFKEKDIARLILQDYGLDESIMPSIAPVFSNQGELTKAAAEITGLQAGTPVTYRAGDQPNNALALNVLDPGEVAATAGTSGVVYGVVDQAVYDAESRVNGFAHVNYSKERERIGILLCINGAGIQHSWMNQKVAESGTTYPAMEELARQIPIGADGVCVLPFGNGAERMLGNQSPGAQILNVHFNRHSRPHLFRAALEGVAFSFVYGMEVLQEMGVQTRHMRVGNDNMFQSNIFSSTISTLVGAQIEVVETTGAVGAAIGAGFGAGVYTDLKVPLGKTEVCKVYTPQPEEAEYRAAYERWKDNLKKFI